jgi:hypothetical protein
VRIGFSSGRGFAGAQESLPSGAMITFRPPRRFQVFGMKTGMASPSSWQFLRATFARDFLCFFHTPLFDQGLHPHPARNLTYMPRGQRKVNPLHQQPHDPRRLSGKRFLLQRIESFQHFPHLSLQNVPLACAPPATCA